ncbi:MAG: hypothetical protein WC359_13480 [Dehalococcoidia bacterium]|jgi:hypothetical protein
MKNLKELKDKYQNQEITVIGAGKSMERYTPESFSERITIGINYVYKRFPVTYTVARHLVVIRESPPNLVYPEITCDLDGLNAPNIPGYRFADELVQSGTTSKTAMDLARYMGAKKIILLGCECYGDYYEGYPTGSTNRAWLNQMRYDQELFIDYLTRRYGVVVEWHREKS